MQSQKYKHIKRSLSNRAVELNIDSLEMQLFAPLFYFFYVCSSCFSVRIHVCCFGACISVCLHFVRAPGPVGLSQSADYTHDKPHFLLALHSGAFRP